MDAAREMNVRMQLRAEDDLDRDRLEEQTMQVLDAIEDLAEGVALDPVAACDFDDHTIEVRFSIQVVAPHDVSDRVGVVLNAVEQVLGDVDVQSVGAEAPALACA